MKSSVIICTHNPRRDYLQRTLAGLQAQTLPREDWELLLVDNASKEPVSAAWDLSWHPHGRHVREDEVGLTAARLRAIKEARGELLVFVDDDNVLDPEFLVKALAVGMNHPFLGVFGAGKLEPEFEVPPAPELKPHLHRLALRTVPAAVWSNNLGDASSVPWGAGLCVTRQVAGAYVQLIGKLRATAVLGRRGQKLFSGEDDVFSWASVWAGRGFGVFPELRITHLISAGRLTRKYFIRLIHDHAFSHGVLDYLLAGSLRPPVGLPRRIYLILHGIKNGRFAMQCEWAGSSGGAAAAGFIAEQGIRPIGDVLKQPPSETRK